MQNVRHRSRPTPGEGLAYYLIFAMSFVVFLAIGAVKRVMQWPWKLPSRASRRPGVFAEAARAAGTLTPFAFMG